MIRGFAVGDKGTIWEYNNGSWTQNESPASLLLRGVAISPKTPDDKQMLACAVGSEGVILRRKLESTVDTGWTSRTSFLGRPVSVELFDIAFASQMVGVAVGAMGKIVRTSDGGETWRVVASGTDSWLRVVRFFNHQYGWAAGNDGCILATQDGGVTWQKQDAQTSDWIRGMCFVTQTSGWIAGSKGLVRTTTDGGNLWQGKPKDVQETTMENESEEDSDAIKCKEVYAQSIIAEDMTTATVVGNAGSIYKTTDGGHVWEREKALDENGDEVYANLRAITACSGNRWAVGSYGTIVQSINGGEWTNLQSGEHDFYAVVMKSL